MVYADSTALSIAAAVQRRLESRRAAAVRSVTPNYHRVHKGIPEKRA